MKECRCSVSEGGVPAHLELPVGRLEELLRLVGGAAGRQNKLVDHHLVPEFFHIHRHGSFLRGTHNNINYKHKKRR